MEFICSGLEAVESVARWYRMCYGHDIFENRANVVYNTIQCLYEDSMSNISGKI